MKDRLYFYKIKQYRVIDADSIDLEFLVGFDAGLQMVCRLEGIDVPEKHTEAGQAITKYVQYILDQAPVLYVRSTAKDKYSGRFLGIIYIDEKLTSLNTMLIDKGFALPYFGGNKKDIWTEETYKIMLGNIKNDSLYQQIMAAT